MCPFCNKEILNVSFLSNDVALAIYNLSPVLPGHSLIIPRRHATSLFELNENEFHQFMELARNTAQLLRLAFNTDALNWSIQEQAPAGQTIPHLHLHLLPRTEGDLPQPGDWYPVLQEQFYHSKHLDSQLRPKLSAKEMKQIVDHLSNYNATHQKLDNKLR